MGRPANAVMNVLEVIGFEAMGRLLTFGLMIAAAFPSSSEPDESGRIYVYAQRETPARSWLRITCGGEAVAELKRGFLFVIAVSPGQHTLGVGSGVPAFVNVDARGEAFVRLDWNHQVGRPPIPVLSAVQPDQGRKEIKYLSYLRAERALSDSVLQKDPRESMPVQLQRRSEK